jgi:hypothetical protein
VNKTIQILFVPQMSADQSTVTMMPVNELLSLIVSDVWQFQVMALDLLLHLVRSNAGTEREPDSTLTNSNKQSSKAASQKATIIGKKDAGISDNTAGGKVGRRGTNSLMTSASSKASNSGQPQLSKQQQGESSGVAPSTSILQWWSICQEMCKLGILRSLFWGLLSTKAVMRRRCYQVGHRIIAHIWTRFSFIIRFYCIENMQLLKEMILIRILSPGAQNNTSGQLSKKEFIALKIDCVTSIVEQGLVPLLEHISTGVPVVRANRDSISPQSAEAVPLVPAPLDCSFDDWQRYYAGLQERSVCGEAAGISETAVASERVETTLFPEVPLRELAASVINVLVDMLKTSFIDATQEQASRDIIGADQDSGAAPAAPSKSTKNAVDPRKAQPPVPSPTQAPTNPPASPLGVLLYKRLVNPLLVSGNNKLKANIFVGLLCLGGFDAEFSQQLWTVPVPHEIPRPLLVLSSSGTNTLNLFSFLLSSLAKDPTALCSVVVSPLLQVLSAALQQQQRDQSATMQSTDGVTAEFSRPRKAVLSPIICCVSYTPSHQHRTATSKHSQQAFDAQQLRMQCPSLDLIRRHSITLATLLQVRLCSTIVRASI